MLEAFNYAGIAALVLGTGWFYYRAIRWCNDIPETKPWERKQR